jgi:hypothetical protein
MAGLDSYTKLLLHMNGTDGGIIFTDDSASNHTVTRTNLTTVTATKKFGSASSERPNSTGKYLTIGNSSDFAFGSGDFTIDFWMQSGYFGSSAWVMSYANGTGDSNYAWKFYIAGEGGPIRFKWYSSTNVARDFINDATGLTDSNFHHYAVIRNGNSGYFAIDGVLGAPTDLTGYSQRDAGNYVMTIGTNYSHSHANYYGFDELRVSKGIARWTSNFTPPTAEYSSADISGILSHEARIVILDENSWTVEHHDIHPAGAYIIPEGPGAGTKSITAYPTDTELTPITYTRVIPKA